MQHPEPRIQCSNPQCAASNALEAHCCHRCDTPIVRRYLWSNKVAINPEEVNGLINGRYLAFSTQIFLDTQPNKPPATPEEVPAHITTYLQLFPCYPNIPQVYGLLGHGDAWLLDYGTVPSDRCGKLDYSEDLIPKLESLWSSASALQQINWLWQIAKLWKPLLSKKVASTLLNPELLRINGQIVQVIQLEQDKGKAPTLKDLGSVWQSWLKETRPEIQDIFQQITSHLITGKIDQVAQTIALLDRAANECQKNREYSYQIYALTDSGPNRSNNEDAAYPMYDEQAEDIQASNTALTIVCDGVGGHDGGEIASQATIEHLHHKISSLGIDREHHSPRTIIKQLTEYINGANDIISERNDSERRQERQRMGTTLVMSLARAHEIYLANVGDSRIYWITRNSCHQVTIDDDLASREVRLGYAIYRDSLQYPSAGALIQALGMRDSTALHPNLQRYLIDDDCIFLLCTDGLSDFDRVEQQWRNKIAPVLEGKQDLSSTVKNLINFANEENGHDNVTVALVHCHVKSKTKLTTANVVWSDIEYALKDSHSWSEASLADSILPDPTIADDATEDTNIPKQPMIGEEQFSEATTVKKQTKWLKPLIFSLVMGTIIGIFIYSWQQKRIEPNENQSPIPERENITERDN